MKKHTYINKNISNNKILFCQLLICLRVMCALNTFLSERSEAIWAEAQVLFVRLWVQSHQRNTDKRVDDTGTQCQPWLPHNEPLTPMWHYYRYSKARMCVYVCCSGMRMRESERETKRWEREEREKNWEERDGEREREQS